MQIYSNATSYENVSLSIVALYTSVATFQIGIYSETYIIYDNRIGLSSSHWLLVQVQTGF